MKDGKGPALSVLHIARGGATVRDPLDCGASPRQTVRAASDSGNGDSVIRVNWQIWKSKEDSSLVLVDLSHFSPPK